MPEYWLDTDSFVTPHRGPYRFVTVPRFWELLEFQAEALVIASSEYVLRELTGQDELQAWANNLGEKMFRVADNEVQEAYHWVCHCVANTPRYASHHVASWLGDADPWVIAHALAKGGKIVTFEKREPLSTKPKIPDIAADVGGIVCLNIWDMVTALGVSLSG